MKMISVMMLAAVIAGCAGSRETGDEESAPAAPRSSANGSGYLDPGLAPAAKVARSIQLYGQSESSLPIMQLGTNDQLTLEFDLMSDRARPLTVFFYHADRTWRRDLMPSEYMSGFFHDQIMDYRASAASQSRYVHYTYRFPNESIDFRLSGNYVLRVTEVGAEDQPLLEQAFFVTEQAANPDLYLEQVLLGGAPFPGTLPLVRFTPPRAIQGNVFDYDVCFVRNGRIERARCSNEPLLGSQPALQFDLEREQAFFPEAADYFVDVSALRVGPGIERTDLTKNPYEVQLAPDYANFPGHPGAPLLNGQPVISSVVTGLGDADVSADYAEVVFTFIPPENEPLEGDLLISGSFNSWQYDPAYRMAWEPAEGVYKGRVLLKQGQYEYRYFSPDRRLRQILSTAMPRTDNLYMAFVYFSDNSVSTDRLLGVGGTMTR